MKTLKQIAAIPALGVEVLLEGSTTRLFFDFTDPDPRPEGEDPWPDDIKKCESIDLEGREYGSIVSAIINDRYDADKNQALMANLELAKDEESELTPEKRAEYLAEYADYQDWRLHAKSIAAIAVSIIEEQSVEEE